MADDSIPDLSPEEIAAQKKEAKRLYNQAWHAAHPGYAARKSQAWHAAHPEADKAYRIAHRADKAASSRRYRARHPEKIKQALREWVAKNMPRKLAYNRQWFLDHPGVKAASDKRYRENKTEEQREADRAYQRARYPKNKAKQAAKLQRWQQANPEKVRAATQRRLATKAAAPINDFTAHQWVIMCRILDYRCCYCDEQFPIEELTMDHLTPYSQGGSNTLHNILPCCLSCNSRKGTRDLLCPVQPFLLLEDK